METLKKSIEAGFMICIAATVYLICPIQLLGAVLFSFGLFVICTFNMDLFTGKIGYVIEHKNHPNCAVIWFGNLIGCSIGSLLIRLAKPEITQTAYTLIQNKLDNNILSVLILGFFCGVLMFIAVENYKNNINEFSRILGIFICVTVFILCGFEHSIADMCYCAFAISSPFLLLQCLLFIMLVTISNSLGAIAAHYFLKEELL